MAIRAAMRPFSGNVVVLSLSQDGSLTAAEPLGSGLRGLAEPPSGMGLVR